MTPNSRSYVVLSLLCAFIGCNNSDVTSIPEADAISEFGEQATTSAAVSEMKLEAGDIAFLAADTTFRSESGETVELLAGQSVIVQAVAGNRISLQVPSVRPFEASRDIVSIDCLRADKQITGCRLGQVAYWDEASGKLSDTFIVRNSPKSDESPGVSPGLLRLTRIVYSPSGKRFAACSIDDQAVIVWDSESGKEFHRFAIDGYPTDVAFSPDDQTIAVAETGWRKEHALRKPDAFDGSVWNLESGEQLHAFDEVSGTYCIAFTDDGKRIAAGARNGGIYLWDAVSGEQVTDPWPAQRSDPNPYFSFGEKLPLTPIDLQFIAGTDLLAVLSVSEGLHLFDTSEYRPSGSEKHIDSSKSLGSALAFSPGGFVAIGDLAGVIRIFDSSHKLLLKFRADESKILALTFSDNANLVSLSEAGIRGWRLGDGSGYEGWISQNSIKGFQKSRENLRRMDRN